MTSESMNNKETITQNIQNKNQKLTRKYSDTTPLYKKTLSNEAAKFGEEINFNTNLNQRPLKRSQSHFNNFSSSFRKKIVQIRNIFNPNDNNQLRRRSTSLRDLSKHSTNNNNNHYRGDKMKTKISSVTNDHWLDDDELRFDSKDVGWTNDINQWLNNFHDGQDNYFPVNEKKERLIPDDFLSRDGDTCLDDSYFNDGNDTSQMRGVVLNDKNNQQQHQSQKIKENEHPTEKSETHYEVQDKSNDVTTSSSNENVNKIDNEIQSSTPIKQQKMTKITTTSTPIDIINKLDENKGNENKAKKNNGNENDISRIEADDLIDKYFCYLESSPEINESFKDNETNTTSVETLLNDNSDSQVVLSGQNLNEIVSVSKRIQQIESSQKPKDKKVNSIVENSFKIKKDDNIIIDNENKDEKIVLIKEKQAHVKLCKTKNTEELKELNVEENASKNKIRKQDSSSIINSTQINYLIQNYIDDNFADKAFNHGVNAKYWCKDLSNYVRENLRKLTKDQHKLIVTSHIGPNFIKDGTHVAIKSQTVTGMDNFITLAFETEHLFIWIYALIATR